MDEAIIYLIANAYLGFGIIMIFVSPKGFYVFFFIKKNISYKLFILKENNISSEVTHLSSYLSKSIEIPKITVSEIG